MAWVTSRAVERHLPLRDSGRLRDRPEAVAARLAADRDARRRRLGRLGRLGSASVCRAVGGAAPTSECAGGGPLVAQLEQAVAARPLGAARDRGVERLEPGGVELADRDPLEPGAVLLAGERLRDAVGPAADRARRRQAAGPRADQHAGEVTAAEPAERPAKFAHGNDQLTRAEPAQRAEPRERDDALSGARGSFRMNGWPARR